MSSFIDDFNIDRLGFDWAKPVVAEGSTCDCFVVQIDGKMHFMKKLKDEFYENITYRNLLKKEFQVGKSICHPNIVKYDSINDNDDACYILMENIVGKTLNEFIDLKPDYFQSRANFDKFFLQLLSALNCLHQNHVVYSDLKPQNIMITQVNNDVKLIDLGFCYTDSFTNTAGTTEGYSAPEHTEKSSLDITTDIYGIGRIIEFIALNSRHNLPNVYSKIMQRCLKVRKQDRFQNTSEIVKLINQRKHTMRKVLISALACTLLFFTYKTVIHTDTFVSWWDSFQIITPDVDYDVINNHSYYSVLSEKDGTCQVVGQDNSPNVYLHKEVKINGKAYRMSYIAPKAFHNKTYLRSVYIPESVDSIGSMAFHSCHNISSINIPNSVTHIGNNAFQYCKKATFVKLSESITTIRRGTFVACKMKTINIPEGVTLIELDAFGICDSLEHVTLPQSLTTLERGVFYKCQSLKNITIPKNVTSIGEYLLFGCDNLTDIYNHAIVPQIVPPIHHNPAQITLHVPKQSIDDYRQTEIWNQMNIVGDL